MANRKHPKVKKELQFSIFNENLISVIGALLYTASRGKIGKPKSDNKLANLRRICEKEYQRQKKIRTRMSKITVRPVAKPHAAAPSTNTCRSIISSRNGQVEESLSAEELTEYESDSSAEERLRGQTGAMLDITTDECSVTDTDLD
jgi:hypothetical protein